MSKSTKIILALLVSTILFIIFYFINPLSLDSAPRTVLAIATFMLSLWFTETLPIWPITLIPLVAMPLAGILTLEQAAANYIDKVVFLFFGGFVLGIALEKWNLHKRIALGIVKITGTSPNRIILGFLIATAFISMWISNTATTMMMYPIAVSVNALMENNYKGKGKVDRFSLVLMLIIAYAANVGGIATIIGTPPNTVLVALMDKSFNIHIGFFEWLIICFPIAVIVLFFSYILLTRVLYPNRMELNAIPKHLIIDEYNKLGKMSKQEWLVTWIFIQTCILWIFREQFVQLLNYLDIPTQVKWMGWKFSFDDTAVALIGAILLMVIPSGSKSSFMMIQIHDLRKVKWGILMLFGGGLCLAMGMEKSGLMQLVGEQILNYGIQGKLVIIILFTLAAVFLSELMSNVALVTVFVPVVGAIALAMNVHPMLFCLPVTLGATCAFMLPMGTPPNAIVYASKKIRLYQMTTAGLILNIISSIVISLTCFAVLNMVFK